MHALVATGTDAGVDSGIESAREQVEAEDRAYQVKGLKPLHKHVASLSAQGLKNVQIARLCDITPEYVHVLLKMPIVQQYMYERIATAGMQLEATFPLVVEVIQDTLRDGSEAGKLKAARLHLEATKRIGRTELPTRPTEDALASLERLAERLMSLQSRAEGQRTGGTFSHDGELIVDV